jgi:hypothetical protein
VFPVSRTFPNVVSLPQELFTAEEGELDAWFGTAEAGFGRTQTGPGFRVDISWPNMVPASVVSARPGGE